MCKLYRGEVEVSCLQVEICKYRNIREYMCKKIEVKLTDMAAC
jgi:hypothetical protein